MKKGISIIVALIMLVALVPQATAATKVSNSSTPGGIDGLDPNPYVGEHNSYAWCSELFHQNDGDYLWVGTNRDLAGNILALAADPSPGVFTVFGIPEPSGDMLGRIYRQRASDPDAPWELIYATPIVSGFRRMIVFNEDLYVVGATTNTPLADYSIVLRFAQGFKPGDKPEIVLWDTIRDDTREHFRAATLFHDKLMIGTFDSKIFTTNGVGLRDLTPNTGNNAPGWDLFIDFRDYGITDAIWDILEFNGSLYAFIAGEEMQDYQSAGDMQMRGFRVMKVTPSSSGLVVKEIVGDTGAPYPFGMGLNKNASASGFLSTSFDQDYVYVTTFASGPALAIGMLKGYYREAFEKLFSPAQVYRFGADDIWEVVVGDTTGANVAVDAAGNPVPYIGNQRGGFSLLPDDRKNTSFNQYTWWMAEYDSKLYVTTWDMSTFKDQWPVYSNKYIDTLIPGANKILNTSYVDLARLHMLLRRDAPNVNWEKLAQDLDDYMVSLEGLDRTNQVALRAAIVGAIPIINSSLPATSVDFRTANQLLVPIITNVVNGTEPSELGAREVVARIVEYFRFTSEYFADNTDPAGFDLFVSEDGVNFEPVTVNGLGDRSNYGGRIMVSSEHGLNLGTANPFNGAQVWRVDPVKLGIYPNGPSSIAMGRSTQSVMTVLVTDARSVLGDLSMSYDSDLVDVQLVKRSSRNVANLSWDNVTVYNASKRVWEYAPEEIVTNTVSDVYEVVLTPTGRGIEALTLNFSLGSATASRTINLSVDSPQVATKQALGERLAEVSRAQRSEYEPETWAPFITAYGEAMLVYNNNSSQSQIDTALENLNAAVSGLRYVQAPEGYTIIKTEDQLRSMTRTGNYWLGNDIQLTKPWTPIAQFDGVLDGNGRTISNLTIGNPTLSNQGFFRRTGGDATIRDVEFVVGNAGIRGYDRVGVVVGWADSSRFIGVRVRVGDGGVIGNRYVGGLAGRVDNSMIAGSFVYGPNDLLEFYVGQPEPATSFAVRGTATTTTHVGGLVGELQRTVVSRSTSYVNVTGYMGVGGLIGNCYQSGIEHSYARGYVVGLTQSNGTRVSYGEEIGGLIGTIDSFSAIENVYSTGVVKSDGAQHINPLIGYASGRLMTRGASFWDTDAALKSSVTTQDMTNIELNNVKGASTRELKQIDTFTHGGATWDFDTIWQIGWLNGTVAETPTYPYFILGVTIQSKPPVVPGVTAGDTTISGVGTSAGAKIIVEFPNGVKVETVTNDLYEWSVEIPPGIILREGEEIKVTQYELGTPGNGSNIIVGSQRPINLSARVVAENQTGGDHGMNLVGDLLKYSVTVFNEGASTSYADRLQYLDKLPEGLTFVAGSVRYAPQNSGGVTLVPANASTIATRGYSYNTASGQLEIRLGDYRLSGGDAVTIQFEARINAAADGVSIPTRTASVTAHRVSTSSAANITAYAAEVPGLLVMAPIDDLDLVSKMERSVVLTDVAVTGSPEVGATLRASVTVAPTSAALSYEWFVNGVVTQGPSAQNTYFVTSTDADKEIAVRVTGTYPYLYTTKVRSEPVTISSVVRSWVKFSETSFTINENYQVLNVDVLSTCNSWRITDDATWVSQSPSTSTRTGTTPIQMTVSANSTAVARTANVTVAGCGLSGSLTITQGPRAVLTSSLTSWRAPEAGGSIDVTLSTNQAGWTATVPATASWLTVTPSGSASDVMTITATRNPTSARSAAITVRAGTATQTIVVSQAVPSLTISRTTWAALWRGDSTSVRVDTSNSMWGVDPGTVPSWLTVVDDDARWMILQAAKNTGPSRQATIIVNSSGMTRSILITQAAAPTATITASPASWAAPAGVGGSWITVTTSRANPWTASSSAAWLKVTSGNTSGGLMYLSVEPNLGTTTRTAQVTISSDGATRVVNVTQAARGRDMSAQGPITVGAVPSPAQWETGLSGSLTVTSSASWLRPTITSNGTILATSTANTGASRTAIVTVWVSGVIAGTYAVVQEGLPVISAGTNWSVVASGGTQTRLVTTNAWGTAGPAQWTSTTPVSWIHLPSQPQDTGTYLTIAVDPNLTGGPRSATVTVTAGSSTTTFTITQQG